MNPFDLIFRPVKHLTEAVVMPFRAVFVVGLCGVINWMTYGGHWWVKWVALGMGIAVLVAWARAAKTLAVLALVAWGGWWLHKRYGEAVRRQFDEWARRTQPQARQVIEMVREKAARATQAA